MDTACVKGLLVLRAYIVWISLLNLRAGGGGMARINELHLFIVMPRFCLS